eukprot:6211378-Pleurochrysis_carterae.AAC.1
MSGAHGEEHLPDSCERMPDANFVSQYTLWKRAMRTAETRACERICGEACEQDRACERPCKTVRARLRANVSMPMSARASAPARLRLR